MAGYSHQKKTNKRTRRVLLAALFWLVPAAAFALLAHFAFFQSPSTASAPEPTPEPVPVWNQGQKELPVDQAPGEEIPDCIFVDPSGNRLADYTWGNIVPECEPVEDDFFSDTAFIGNSLAQGFMLYSGMKTPDYYATQSITVSNIFYEKAINAGGGKYITILDAMARKDHSKVYIMLGLNEINWTEEKFISKYSILIDRIREIQPGAVIYLQSMTPVTKEQSDSGSVFNNKRIRRYNELIQALAAEKKVHYLDVYSSIANEDGDLPAGGSFDGIHPYTKYYKAWRDYLKCHVVLEEKI